MVSPNGGTKYMGGIRKICDVQQITRYMSGTAQDCEIFKPWKVE